MVVDRTQIIKLVFAAVDDVNKQLHRTERLEKSLNTVISGDGSRLDSLGLVNLIFAVEQEIEHRYCVTVPLAEEEVLSEDQDPLRTLGSLTDYIQTLLETRQHGRPS